MAVHKKHVARDDPKVAPAVSQPKAIDDSQPISVRGGKEQEAIYQQESKILAEVQEKYKEADKAAEKQIEDVLGKETRSKVAKLPNDVVSAGIKSREEEASEVLKKDGTLEIATTEDELKKDLGTSVGGKRLINKTIVGAQSVLGWALRLSRLVKMAHKHARKVVFRGSNKSGEGV